MSDDLTRVSLMIRKQQHDQLREMDVNISGYIRDLIDDRLSDHTVVLSVNPDTKKLYDQMVSYSGDGDRDFEPYLREALKKMLGDKIKNMAKLHQSLEDRE